MASEGALPAVLVLGCSGGGKSSIVSHWKMLCAESSRSHKPKDSKRGELNRYQFNVTPNSGYERDALQYGNRSFVVMEVGGGMKGNWSSYFTKCQAIIYVLDKSNRRQLAAVAFDLVTLLTHPKLSRVPVLFVLNKCDLPNALTRTELQSLIRFDDVLASAPQLPYLFPRNPPQLRTAAATAAAAAAASGAGGANKDGAGDGTGSGTGTVSGALAHGPHHHHNRTSSWSPQSVALLLANTGSSGPPGGYYRLIPPVPLSATVSQPLPYQTFGVTIAAASTGSAIQAAHAAAKVTAVPTGAGAVANVALSAQPATPALAGLHQYTTPARNSGANNTFTGSALPPAAGAATYTATAAAGGISLPGAVPSSATVSGAVGGGGVGGTFSKLDFKHSPVSANGFGSGSVDPSGTAGGILPGAKAVSVTGPEPKSPKGKRTSGSGAAAYDWAGASASANASATVGGVTGPAKAMLKLPTASQPSPAHGAVMSPTNAATAKTKAGGGGSPALHPQHSNSQLNGPISARDTIPAAPSGPVVPPSLPVFETSAVTRAGVAALLDYVALLLHQLPAAPTHAHTHAGHHPPVSSPLHDSVPNKK